MSGQIRVLLADDHAIVRAGLRTILENEHDVVAAGEAATGPDAKRLCEELRPDVLIADLSVLDSPATVIFVR
jgi:DNA-binding NarL/FixJ family response regulator